MTVRGEGLARWQQKRGERQWERERGQSSMAPRFLGLSEALLLGFGSLGWGRGDGRAVQVSF